MQKTKHPPQTSAATCVYLPGKSGGGVLLRGKSGAGKSDLALRLIIEHGALLVADDQVTLSVKGKQLLASPPARLKGLLEVRGVGIIRFPVKPQASVRLAVNLTGDARIIERLPEPETVDMLGVALPLIRLCARDVSAPAKLLAALYALHGGHMAVGVFKE